MLIEMYKRVDGKRLVVVGHLSKAEIRAYKKDGYRMYIPNINKNGIRVDKRVG